MSQGLDYLWYVMQEPNLSLTATQHLQLLPWHYEFSNKECALNFGALQRYQPQCLIVFILYLPFCLWRLISRHINFSSKFNLCSIFQLSCGAGWIKYGHNTQIINTCDRLLNTGVRREKQLENGICKFIILEIVLSDYGKTEYR